MTDRSRELERQWRASGSDADYQRYLNEMARLGLTRSLNFQSPFEISEFRLSYKNPSLSQRLGNTFLKFSTCTVIGRTPRRQLGPLRVLKDQLVLAQFLPLSPLTDPAGQRELKDALKSGLLDGLFVDLGHTGHFEALKDFCLDCPLKVLMIRNGWHPDFPIIDWSKQTQLQHLSILGARTPGALELPLDQLTELQSFHCDHKVSQDSLKRLQACSKLEALSLDQGLPKEAACAWSLKSLHATRIKDLPAVLQELPALEQLSLKARSYFAAKYEDQDWQAIGALSELRALGLSAREAQLAPLSQCQELRVLDLQAGLGDQWPLLKRFTKLRHLHVQGLSSNHKSTRVIELSLPDGLISAIVASPLGFPQVHIQGGRQLKRLKLSTVALSANAEIEQFNQLEELTLHKVHGLLASQLRAIVQFPRLHTLRIRQGPWDNELAATLSECSAPLKFLAIGPYDFSLEQLKDLQQRLPKTALQCLQELPKPIQQRFLSAQTSQGKDPDGSLEACHELLKERPEAIVIHNLIVSILRHERRYDEACEQLSEILRFSNTASALSLRGKLHFKRHRFQEAYFDTSQVMEWLGPQVETLQLRIEAAVKLKRMDWLKRDLRTLLEIYETAGPAAHTQARPEFNQLGFRQSYDCYKRVAELQKRWGLERQ